MKSCYMCLEQETSREHVPPRCLFPKINDIGVNYRKDLITVPSCDKHNSEKSEDDQFLFVILLIHFKNNQVGQYHFSGKWSRTVERDRSLLEKYLNNKVDVILNRTDSIGFQIDRDRFNTTMDRIARGLHFFEYGERWDEQLIISTPHLFDTRSPDAAEVNRLQQELQLNIDTDLALYFTKGENPAVFYYRIDRDPKEKILMINMVFYEGFVVSAYSSPKIASWQRNLK